MLGKLLMNEGFVMVSMEQLLQTVDELPPDDLRQLYHYVVGKVSDLTQGQSQASASPRIAGLHAHFGPVWMSEDFDDPLPDEFWLGD